MAITIRGGTPVTTSTVSNPISVTLDGTRQPQSSDVLLVFHGNDFYALSNMATPTCNGSSTGVTAITNGVSDQGSNEAHVKAYYFVVSSSGDVTVSVTETGSADEEKVLVAYTLSGVDTASPIDGGSSGAAGSGSATGLPSHVVTGVTPSGTDAMLFIHLNTQSENASPWTPPSSPFVELVDDSGALDHTGGNEQLSASGATGSRTFTPTASSKFAAVAVAVKTGSVAAPTYAMLRPAVVAP